MGCTQAKEGSKEDISASRKIDEQLRKDKRELETEVKLLLLGEHPAEQLDSDFVHGILITIGAGESGKSTITKQMKIIFLKGFTKEEKESYR